MSDDAPRANDKPEHLDRLSSVWRRFSDRKIAQWSVAYVALAYAIQHGVVLTEEAYEWPHAVQQISMLLLTLGVPVVMTFAWYHGERASRRISGPELTIIAILLAIGSLFFYVLVKPEGEATASRAKGVQEASLTAARNAAADPHSAISLAVLPFVNLSSDKEQEFFSDGMTEEITTALAKVPDLRVVGRTSAFQFKGQNQDLRAIGQALSATHLIEGSVRKAGTRVRITAQLIKADDGTHIWAEDYDRELTDVFAIQEEIARAITASLRMPLGLKSGEQLVSNRAIDAESYEQFLRGKAVVLQARGQFARQLALLEPVVAKNPNYAPAWAALAQAYRYAAQVGRYASPQENAAARALYLPKFQNAAKRATELDPNLVDGHVQLAYSQQGPRRLLLTEDVLLKALSLDPNHPDALDRYGNFLLGVARIKDAVSAKQKLHQLEPGIGLYEGNLAEALWLDGQTDAAIALWQDNLDAPGAGARMGLSQIYASQGRFKEAAELAAQMAADPRFQQIRSLLDPWVRLMRYAPAKLAAPEKEPRLADFSFVYLYVGAPERALEPYEQGGMGFNDVALLWHPSYAPVRKSERFKKFIRDEGLVAYWRERGWPSLCHPVGTDDFACE